MHSTTEDAASGNGGLRRMTAEMTRFQRSNCCALARQEAPELPAGNSPDFS